MSEWQDPFSHNPLESFILKEQTFNQNILYFSNERVLHTKIQVAKIFLSKWCPRSRNYYGVCPHARFMIFLHFPHFLALRARAEVYSLQLSGLIKGRSSADWFDQQQHRHLNCTRIESHFCSAREMSLVSRASAQMQIRLKSFRQTIQACARENTFQGNNWDSLMAQYADFSAKKLLLFFNYGTNRQSVCISLSKNWNSSFYICWQINFFRPLNIYLSVAKHFLHSRSKGGIIILASFDFSREDHIFVRPFYHILVYMKMQIGLQRCTERLYPQWSNHLIKESGWRSRIFPMEGMFRNLEERLIFGRLLFNEVRPMPFFIFQPYLQLISVQTRVRHHAYQSSCISD